MSACPYRNGNFNRINRSLCPYFATNPEHMFNTGETFGEVINTKEKFAVSVDVSQFTPEEIKVNVAGNELTIKGHHEERTDKHGSIQRSFVRKYTLPEDVNVDGLHSSLSTDGKLAVEAPKKAIEGPQARAIPIMYSKH